MSKEKLISQLHDDKNLTLERYMKAKDNLAIEPIIEQEKTEDSRTKSGAGSDISRRKKIINYTDKTKEKRELIALLYFIQETMGEDGNINMRMLGQEIPGEKASLD